VTLAQGAFLFGAALLAGALNSVAGGGGFIAFPALIFTGMPPIQANATNATALWPGTVASTGAYWHALDGEARRLLLPLTVTGVAGGLLGAIILLKTPQRTFLSMVPWLLLGATLLFVFSGRITVWMRRRTETMQHASHLAMLGAALVQLVIALYIGFFGAGAGILMLALLALMGMKNIHAMNGLKTMLASICNGMAVATFIVAKAIIWPQALLMIVGAALGGYGGAWYAQKIPPARVRQFVIVVGFAMSAYFFAR
jgi:uncharacterized membrane protein YfcA